jgi:hypothetical protein
MSSRELLGLFLGGALYSALAAAFGVGVGAVLRNQIAGIVALLLVLFVAAPTCFRSGSPPCSTRPTRWC